LTILPLGLEYIQELNCDNNLFNIEYKLTIESLKKYYNEHYQYR
jgi:hypothetical protein